MVICSFLRYGLAAGGRRRKSWRTALWNLFTRTVIPEVLEDALQHLPGTRNAFALSQLTLPLLGKITFQAN